ncbi:hypothetical protein OAD44_00880 [Flavobacteriaceae bacterium]|nr:hypothetical protein [Flavobacteriaceae bacterium]
MKKLLLLLIFVNFISCESAVNTKKENTRPIGEIWYDENDNKFEQKDGYVLKNCGCSDYEISDLISSMGSSRKSSVLLCCQFAEIAKKSK